MHKSDYILFSGAAPGAEAFRADAPALATSRRDEIGRDTLRPVLGEDAARPERLVVGVGEDAEEAEVRRHRLSLEQERGCYARTSSSPLRISEKLVRFSSVPCNYL